MNTMIKLGWVALVLTAGCASVPRTSPMTGAALAAKDAPEQCIPHMTCIGDTTSRETVHVASTAGTWGHQGMRSRERRASSITR
jgi:5,10-methylenetetrahydrofolate reductase